MTIEEIFSDLYDKYDEDFNWYMIPLTQADGVFVTELKNEIGEDHFLYDKRIRKRCQHGRRYFSIKTEPCRCIFNWHGAYGIRQSGGAYKALEGSLCKWIRQR